MSERGSALVAMSGGVDSSVAAAMLLDRGYAVTGVTMRLWGGESDTGCCSVSDVDDARRVADHLGIEHHVFNFSEEFSQTVVDPYVAAHREGRTPNPCIECNRHLKFDRLLTRGRSLGFDVVATGHHARIVDDQAVRRLARAVDVAKDQSYVLYMLGQQELASVRFPIGDLTKAEVRRRAERLGLRTAHKPDSQDVCFVASEPGRAGFLGERLTTHAARVVDADGGVVGAVDAVELVTIGQRRGLGVSGSPSPRYVLDVDVPGATVTIGRPEALLDRRLVVDDVVWSAEASEGAVTVQTSAHGPARPATIARIDGTRWRVEWIDPTPRVAAGQSVVFYEDDRVLGGGIATRVPDRHVPGGTNRERR